MSPPLPPHLQRYADVAGDALAFADALAAPLPQTLFTNTARLSPEALAERVGDRLSLTPLPWRPGAFRLAPEDRPGRDWSFTSGLYSVQEEASLLPPALLDVRPGHRVLDLCAAPGNKTAQLALALGNRGTLVANDLKTQRLSPLHDLLRRLGIVNVSTTGHDGSVYPVADGQFDRILVDAPCTAEGKARRGYLRDSPAGFRRWVTGQQRALLRRATALLRPGGRLVYSTCTFAPEENEAVVQHALEEAGEHLRIVAVAPRLPGAAPGLTEWEGRRFAPELRHTIRLWPHLSDTGGFYAAVLERTGPAPTAPPAPIAYAPLPSATDDAGLYAQFERFSIPSETLAAHHFFVDDRHLRVVAADHRPPAGVAYENLGIDVARRRARQIKLSTAGAMAIAAHARQNVLDLDEAAFAAWRARRTQPCPQPRDRGVVLVRHRGLVHGTAFVRPSPQGMPELESQFPKVWMLGDAAAPDTP